MRALSKHEIGHACYLLVTSLLSKAAPAYAGWHAPDLNEESGEFERVAQEHGLSREHVLAAAQGGELGPLDPQLLNSGTFDNYSGVPNMTLDYAHKMANEYGRDSHRIEAGFRAGSPMPAPIVLYGLPGKSGPHLMAGNTRTMVAHGMGIPVQALHINLGYS